MAGELFEKRAEEMEVQHELDTCGLFCPEPVMMLHNKIRDMSPGVSGEGIGN